MNIVKTIRKEKPMLIKISLSFFVYPPKLVGYFGKLMKLNSERSETSITY